MHQLLEKEGKRNLVCLQPTRRLQLAKEEKLTLLLFFYLQQIISLFTARLLSVSKLMICAEFSPTAPSLFSYAVLSFQLAGLSILSQNLQIHYIYMNV